MGGSKGGERGCMWCICFSPFISYIRETRAAANVFAPTGFPASMRSSVDVQGTALDEGFAASLLLTSVRPLTRVDVTVPLQVRIAIETFSRC